MIERYSTEQMRTIWSLQKKFSYWKDLEVYACEYWNSIQQIPDEDLINIQTKANFRVDRILEIEGEVHHDVIAFLTNMGEYIGPSSRFVHFGLTSSDVVDTVFSKLIQDTGVLILQRFKDFLDVLYQKSIELKSQVIVGRTHGIHAEPTTLGFKLLGYFTESQRNYTRLKLAFEECSFGKISGAVGTYSQVPIELEEYVVKKLGLQVEPVSTQVIPRDRYAYLLNQISLTAQGLARLAQEIRLLQKSESREIEEPFQKGQKGSSAMPHKRNPILCERVCGLSRVLMGYAQTGQQNILLWHERDISHSSSERIIFPDATSLLEYMLIKMTFVIEKMYVYPENCIKVMDATGGLLFSSKALLLIMKKLEISREDAYAIVQTEAMKVWSNINEKTLRDCLETHEKLQSISKKDWEKVFDPKEYLKNIDKVFERVSPS